MLDTLVERIAHFVVRAHMQRVGVVRIKCVVSLWYLEQEL